MATIGSALRQAVARLQPGIDDAALDARLLLAHALGLPTVRLYSDPQLPIATADMHRFDTLVERRAAGEPVAYITGRCGFWTLELDVNPAVLIPRPDTETLVQAALDLLPETACGVADLGTGSGAIALALAGERPHWLLTATDISAQALTCARGNARRLGLDNIHFTQGHWLAPLDNGRHGAIIANPPYVAPDDAHLHAPELGHEPVKALVANDHGLADLAHIADHAPAHLEPGGWLMLEHGFDQAEAVRALLVRAGLDCVTTRPDLAGRPRVTMGRRTSCIKAFPAPRR